MSIQIQLRGKIFSTTRLTSKNDNIYILLVIKYNIPFKTKYIKFCIWDESKLLSDGVQLKENAQVYITYHYDQSYPLLDEIKPQEHDECFRCFTNLEQADAQRMGCQFCGMMRYEDHRERLDLNLKLIEVNIQSFKYSLGVCLKFYDEGTKLYFNATIFENCPLYRFVKETRTLNYYRVIAWKENNSVYNTIDIADIFEN